MTSIDWIDMENIDYMEELMEETKESFVINNDKTALWAARKIKEEQAEMERQRELAESEIQRLKYLQQEYQDRFERRTANLKNLLFDYFHTVPRKATKTQESYKLLDFTLRLKKQNPEFVRDEEILTAWAKENTPELVKVKESTDWANLKKLTAVDGENVVFAESGEIIPGIVAKAREDVFEVI